MYTRLRNLKGNTRQIRTGEGNIYITVTHDNEGNPREIFATRGKGGTCDAAFIDALTRLVSLALQHDIPVGSIVKQLHGITCHPGFDTRVVGSVPDAMSLALEEDMARQTQGSIEPELPGTLGNICSDCGVQMIPAGGCEYCPVCGESKCG